MAVVPLDNSVIFKKLFSDPEVLFTFIHDLLGIQLDRTTTTIETEKRFAVPMGAIDTQFDIFVEAPNERVVIEIQKVRYGYHYDCFLDYHNAALIELQKRYRHYTLERTVYTIVWLTARSRDPRFQKGLVTTSYHSVASDGSVLPIYPHKLLFINPAYLDASVPAPVADWLRLAAESIQHPANPQVNRTRPILERALSLIEDDNLTPAERARIMDENDYEQSREVDREEGRKQGLQLGVKRGQQSIAQAMLAKGYDLASIMELTGLTEDDLRELGQLGEGAEAGEEDTAA